MGSTGHRLFLHRDAAGQWIWATPDVDVQVGDLSAHRVVPLPQNGPFPPELVAEHYTVDPFARGALQYFRT